MRHTHLANYKKVNCYKQLFQGSFCDFTKYDFFQRYLFKTFNHKFFLQISEHIQKIFLDDLSASDYMWENICGSNFRQIFRGLFFCLWWNWNYPSRFIFAFALRISNMLIVQKEELFIKSPNLQVNHAHNNKLKSRSF